MTKANDLASLLDANGDVVSSALDNVPPSNDASALSTGTLPDGRFPAVLPAVSGANLTSLPASTDASALTTGTLAAARLPSSGVDAASLTTGILAKSQLPADQILQIIFQGNTYGAVTFPQAQTYVPFWSGTITPSSASSKIMIIGSQEVELNGGNYPALFLSLRRGTSYSIYDQILRGYEANENNHNIFGNPIMWIDSPATTSAVTYYYYGRNATGSSYTGTYGGRGNVYNPSYAFLIELKG